MSNNPHILFAMAFVLSVKSFQLPTSAALWQSAECDGHIDTSRLCEKSGHVSHRNQLCLLSAAALHFDSGKHLSIYAN